MIRFNKINFGLLMLLFLCRFENILGTLDKNIEKGLKEKYKIVDLKGTTLKNEQGEDFSFIVTCKCEGNCYKWFEGIEFDIENIKKEGIYSKQMYMENKLKVKSGVYSFGDILKTNDGKVLVVKDTKKENKVYLVLGIYDKNSKTANIFLDKNYKLQTSGPYDIEEDNTIRVVMSTDEDCGGTLIQKEVNGPKSSLYEFQIVCCELKDVKPEVSLEELVDHSSLKKSIFIKEEVFVEDSCCCDCLCN